MPMILITDRVRDRPAIRTAAFSPDGRRLLVTDTAGRAQLIELPLPRHVPIDEIRTATATTSAPGGAIRPLSHEQWQEAGFSIQNLSGN